LELACVDRRHHGHDDRLALQRNRPRHPPPARSKDKTMKKKPPLSGYINTSEARRRFPRFKKGCLYAWWKFGHSAINGRLKRKPVPGRKRYYLYNLKQLQQINAYWDQAEASESPREVRDGDGTICLRADLAEHEYELSLHDLYDWKRLHCPWLDESQNPVNGRRTPHKLRAVLRSHFGKVNKRRYKILYFRRDQLDEIKQNRSEWKRWKEKGWLFQNRIGKDQGIPSGFFRSWCLKGFPKGAPKLERRFLLCPTPDGRTAWRPMYAPDSIKSLADWYNGLPSADEPYRGENGTVYRKAGFLLRLYARRTGKRPPAPSGRMGRPPAHALTATLLQRWRGTGCDELDGEILDARLVKMRLSTGRTSDVWVYDVDEVKRMVAARMVAARPGERKLPTRWQDATRYHDKGWLFQSEVGQDQSIPRGVFRNWCFTGVPKDAPKLVTRPVLCPTAAGKSRWRVMYAPDSIKRLADWYNGLPIVAARQGDRKPPAAPQTPPPPAARTEPENTPAQETPAVFSCHDDRDKWIYEQAMNGREWDRIRSHLDKHQEWEPIGTVNGVKDAARRYARRHGKPVPPRRKHGRPAGK
jgi:hypothetical protein